MRNIRVGNAPCSWGTLEFGSTKSDRITYDQMLDELKEAGYTGAELGDWGFMPTDPDTLAAEFKKRDLEITGAFVGVALKDRNAHETGEEIAVRTARLLAGVAERLHQKNMPFLVLADDNGTDPVRTKNAGRIRPEMGLSEEEWQVFAAGAERIAKAIRDRAGLQTAFHHHCAGFIETPEEIDRLMALTDPDLLGLALDTGHYSYGAGGCADLLDGLNRFASRIRYVHFKDFDPVVGAQAREKEWDYFQAISQGVFCELGKGCVDFPAVLRWLENRGYEGYITVEQDVLPGMGAPKESARRNRAYLRSIGLR
jgi:inosose dehydratase